ncbi:MAG: bifunctional aspartate kinase/homoserine dehydrogenase I [Treponema sp.]|jgi:aspartokinase/homoserine dehydrogenase 1|nr:bifunctional aspartate kinase/homoserine dehydrogenase I [Treponema sp.]
MLILKLGGSAIGSPQGIEKIIDVLKGKGYSGNVPAVIVSAFSGVTDTLIETAKIALEGGATVKKIQEIRKRHIDYTEIFLKGAEKKKAVVEIEKIISELLQILDGISLLGELTVRSMDIVMSFGERLSANLLACIFTANGIKADYLDARTIIKTDANFGRIQVLKKETEEKIKLHFKKLKTMQVITGAIGSTLEGHTTTIGQHGSDLTAAIVASAIGTKKLEMWRDVDGILTANPVHVKNAFRIDEISYIEAMEMSHFGSRVISPMSVRPVLEKGISIYIRNVFNTACPGTKIAAKTAPGKFPICGISSISSVALVRIQGSGMVGIAGFSARVFASLARKNINVMLITQSSSEYSICFAVLPNDAQNALAALDEEFAREIRNGSIDNPVAELDLSIVAVVGQAMKSTSGISGKFFHSLGRNGINIVAIAQGSSETNISAVISKNDEAKALNAIHDAFFHAQEKYVNLFLVGTGNIGGTLLDQIADNSETLKKNMIKINLIGAANFFGMTFNINGLDPKQAKKMLNDGAKGQDAVQFNLTPKSGKQEIEKKFNLFIDKMIQLNLPNSCFCDCTASEEVSASYDKILHHAISIVTPNKKANSGKLDYYRKLISYSIERGIPYLYETTVGAGLPVISTLRDLYLSGDNVIRIETVPSGTLSFIFNNFDGSKPFSALVREAKDKGYTEPDPRDDLNAMDAARKALILGREIGLPLEFKDVKIEPILPPSCLNAKSVDAFFKELEKCDNDFEKRRAAAAKDGKALRYVAVVENGKAKLALRAEEAGSPFRSLVDSDNIVVITTERYKKLPMVIKGPGAGAAVTAGGIFADIVRTARTLV